MRLRELGLAALIIMMLGATPAASQELNGFMKNPRECDVAFSYTTESYDRFWVGKSRASDPGLGEVTTDSASLWVGCGLTSEMTLFATLPFVQTSGDGLANMEQSDFQDATVLVARRLLMREARARHELVGAVGGRTPVGDYPANRPVAVGDGSSDGLLRLTYLLRHRGLHLSLQVGADLRSSAPDGYPSATELGWTRGRVTCSLRHSMLTTPDGSDIGDPGFTFPGNREEYARVEGKVFVRASRGAGLAVSVFDTLDGRNTGESTGVSIGAVVGF